MSMCLSCGRSHDSWRAYCTNCMQTQAITKHMDSMNNNRPVLPTMSVNSSTSSFSDNSFFWRFSGLGVFAFVAWFFYMLYTLFISSGQFSGWDFIIGVVAFIWAANDM